MDEAAHLDVLDAAVDEALVRVRGRRGVHREACEVRVRVRVGVGVRIGVRVRVGVGVRVRVGVGVGVGVGVRVRVRARVCTARPAMTASLKPHWTQLSRALMVKFQPGQAPSSMSVRPHDSVRYSSNMAYLVRGRARVIAYQTR